MRMWRGHVRGEIRDKIMGRDGNGAVGEVKKDGRV
jgi:hypothetical protein